MIQSQGKSTTSKRKDTERRQNGIGILVSFKQHYVSVLDILYIPFFDGNGDKLSMKLKNF